MDDSRADIIKEATAEIKRWYNTYNTELEMGVGGLLLIFEGASEELSVGWRETGAIKSLTEHSPDVHRDGDRSISHPTHEVPFDSSYLYRTLAQTWEIKHNTEIDELPVVDPGWMVPFVGIENPANSYDEAGKMRSACEQFYIEAGVCTAAGNLKYEPHIRLITGALEALITDITQSLYTEREFLALQLAPTETYTQLAELFEQIYGNPVTAGTVNKYKSRAETKQKKAHQTVDLGHHSQSMSDLQLQPREQSLLTERQRQSLITEIRTAHTGSDRHSDTYISFELGSDYTLAIEVTESGEYISVSIGAPLSRMPDPITIEGDITNIEAYEEVAKSDGRETRFREVGVAECQTVLDLWETLSQAVTPGIGIVRDMRACNIYSGEAEDPRVRFSCSVHMDRQTDSGDALIHGHKYRWPGNTGLDETDEIFTLVRNHEHDIYVQYESGYATAFGSVGQSDGKMRDLFEYIGPGTPQPYYPCRPENHNFGDETLPNPDKRAICNRCGYSIDTLEFTCMSQWRESLPFTCECCGKLNPPQHRNLVHPDFFERQVCDSCWNTTYFPEVDLTKDGVEDSIVTCNNFATSFQESKYVHPSESTASCRWIGRLTPDQVKNLFEVNKRDEVPHSAKPCPGCEAHETYLFTIIQTDDVMARALREILGKGDAAGDTADVPLGDALFEDDEGSQVLSPETHNAVLTRYHDLEQA